jgi:hypothetical protein
MAEPKAKTIAEKLSEAQRAALEEQGDGNVPCLATWAHDPIWRELWELGLCDYWTDALTVLGLQVRDILKGEA